jgi:hypothetical protein
MRRRRKDINPSSMRYTMHCGDNTSRATASPPHPPPLILLQRLFPLPLPPPSLLFLPMHVCAPHLPRYGA